MRRLIITSLLVLPAMVSQELYALERPWQQGVHYTIEAELDTTARRLNGTLRLTYHNHSPDTLTTLYLQVPSNAYHDERNTAVQEMQRIAGSNVEFDQTQHPKLTLQTLEFLAIGNHDEFPIQAYDFSDTILDLRLPYQLMPDDSLLLEIDFYLELDESGTKKNLPSHYTLWFPRVCVYDQQGWHDEPFHFLMESQDVYAEFADFDVTLTVPHNYIMAASGKVTKGDPGWSDVEADTGLTKEQFTAWHDSIRTHLSKVGRVEGARQVRFTAKRLQNFTWNTSPNYVYYAHHSKFPLHILYYGKTALAWLQQLLAEIEPVLDFLEIYFGRYPFDHLTVIRSGYDFTSNPMLARITDYEPLELAARFTSITFPGIVGSNGVQEAWLAKGLQVYTAKAYTEQVYGKMGYDLSAVRKDMNWLERQYPLPGFDEVLRNISHLYMESGQNEPIANKIDRYRDPVGLIFNVYLKSELFYEMLHHVVGDSVFKASTREIVQRFSFSHIKEQDVKTVFEEKYGDDLDWFFEQWLHATPRVDYAKGAVRQYRRGDATWVTEVELKREGDGIMPVDVEVKLHDGRKVVKRWDGKSEAATVVVETTEKPEGVKVDPNNRIMDSNRLNDTSPRLEFRPDWPLLKYIHMPNDAYLVLWRPLIGYNEYDSVRLGMGTSTSYRAFYHNLTLDAMFAVASKELDVEVGYSNPLPRGNLMNRYAIMVRKNEGRFEADARVQFRGSEGILAQSSRRLDIGLNISDVFNQAYTFREVASDTGTLRFDEWQDVRILLAFAEGQAQYVTDKIQAQGRIRIQSALPGGDRQFTKISSRLTLDTRLPGFDVTLRGNGATALGPDPLPTQDQFRAEGANARDRFQNDVVKTGGGLTSFSRRYVAGGGFLRGYLGQPLPAERFATANLEIQPRISLFLGLKPFAFFDTGRIWTTRASDSFARSDAGLGIALFGKDVQLFGGNINLFQQLSAKVLFPIWLSAPLPGEGKTRFRWYFSVGKSLKM